MQVSVILTTHNRTKDCIKCLDRLEPQITKDIEVILLNDFYLEDEHLKEYCTNKNIRYLHTGIQKKGKPLWRVPGFALNIGAKIAKGYYYIIGGAEMYHIHNNCLELMTKSESTCSPVVYDQNTKDKDITKYKTFPKLDNKLPFCYGVSAEVYHYIGGYDEDFTGYCFEDNDFTDRVQKLIPFETVEADIVHLWQIRGVNNRGPNITQQSWNYNKQLYETRKKELVRNKNKDWGKFDVAF